MNASPDKPPTTIYASRAELEWTVKEMYARGLTYIAIDYRSGAIWHDLAIRDCGGNNPNDPILIPEQEEDIDCA